MKDKQHPTMDFGPYVIVEDPDPINNHRLLK